MPHATLKLQPGVDQNRTLALNEAAISYSQLVRFIPDKQGLGLVQKLGGWTRFFPSNIGSTARALWAWQDTNAVTYLGVGSQPRRAAISAISGNGTTVTVDYVSASQFTIADTVVINGVSPAAYNGSYRLTAATYNIATGVGYVQFASTAVGAATIVGATISAADGLSVISQGVRTILTPRTQEQNASPVARTTIGSPVVTITAAGANLYSTDTAYIETQISVGGLILFGAYRATYVDANNFQITARDVLGNPQAATSTVNPGGGSVPSFAFTSGSASVSVTLADHGFEVGDQFTVLVPLTSAGVTLSGNYTVASVTSTSVFTIQAQNAATANASASLNGGSARFIYYKTPGQLPTSTGYGVGGYGVGGYGTGVAPTVVSSGNQIYATDWSLDNWGQIFVSCPSGGPVFTWDPTAGVTQASIITQAPMVNDGVFVAMPQRQIIAWGSTRNGVQDPLLIRWCDVDDYTQWTALPTNQAGSYRLPKGSKIVGCIQGPQQGLVWTDLGVWAMQYSGPPYVYQFNEIGNGCGLIGRKAATSMNGVVYWMSQSQFCRLAGSGVETITCPVWDVIFQDLDTSNLDKIRIAANSRFNEISWFYPTTTSGGEIAKYVKFNVALGTWDFGDLARTAWINQSVLGAPIGAGPASSANYIYQHETSPDADGQAMTSSFQTGYFVISDGEWKVFVDQVWPDMKWGYYGGAQDADLTITFYVTDYPHQEPRVYGPYAFNNQTDFLTPRFRGRLVSIKLESTDAGSFWRIGATRYRFQQDGKF